MTWWPVFPATYQQEATEMLWPLLHKTYFKTIKDNQKTLLKTLKMLVPDTNSVLRNTFYILLELFLI